MTLDPATCYRALAARDSRFDGLFFVGVTTTGIYCRPVCRARIPRADRCRFHPSAAAAEADGFRPCLRCRPERAPGRSSVDATARLAHAAAERIAAGALNDAGLDVLAASLHSSPRQLRRAVRREYGASPVQLAQTHRLLLAKQLLAESSLSMTQVAFASGFSSVRRFNALFHNRYRMSPSRLRGGRGPEADGIALTLDYRPPLDWGALLAFLSARAIPGVEWVRDGRYARTVVIGGHRGWIGASPGRPATLEVEVSLSLAPVLMPLLARLRALFDLDAEPTVIGAQLGADPMLAPLVARRPGLRVPGAIDPFEVALRAVLGQQVTVAGATTLARRISERFAEAADVGVPGLTRFPVEAAALAEAGAASIAAIGIPKARAECIIRLTRSDLALQTDPEAFVRQLQELPGIGPWTAQYIAMRALRWPDAFPHSDLVLRRSCGNPPPARMLSMGERWRPWRAYATMHLWQADRDARREPVDSPARSPLAVAGAEASTLRPGAAADAAGTTP